MSDKVMGSKDIVQVLETHNKCLDRMNEMMIHLARRVDTLTMALERSGVEAVQACRDEDELVKRLTAAMREADRDFEQVGGSTRHHVRDCLMPILGKHGLVIACAEKELSV